MYYSGEVYDNGDWALAGRILSLYFRNGDWALAGRILSLYFRNRRAEV